MIAIPILTRLYVERPPDVALRAWTREIMPAAHAEEGDYWRREYLPLHFQPFAHNRYRYQQRSAKYLARKRRLAEIGEAKLGGTVDLVLSGDTADAIQSLVTVRGYPSRVTIEMIAPNYVTFKPFTAAGSAQPDKPDEITRVIPIEEQKLTEVLGESATARLDAYRSPITIAA